MGGQEMSLTNGFTGFGPVGIVFFVLLTIAMLGVIIYNGLHRKRPYDAKYNKKPKKKKKKR
jgi:hypothetical protein